MENLTLLILPEIRSFLMDPDHSSLQAALKELHPVDIADLVENLDEAEGSQLFAQLEFPQQIETLKHLTPPIQVRLLETLDTERMVRLIEQMSPDDRADLMQILPEETVDTVMPLIAQAERNDILRLSSYPEDTTGALMTSEYAALPEDLTAGQALEWLRRIAPHRETIYTVYVVDEERRLVGTVSLQELVLARPNRPLAEIINHTPLVVRADDDQETVAELLRKYDFLDIPVVDERERLVGIVTYDDAMDVLVDAGTEDVQRLGGSTPLDVPYFQTGFWQMVRKRASWLCLLFLGEMFTGTALRHFESILGQVMLLVFFVPLIISSGGNSGSQSVTLITRGLAVGDVGLRDWARVLWRETSMGLALGLVLGGIGLLRALFWGTGWTASLVVALTLGAVVVFGTLAGALLPLFFKRLGLDPAITSSPFVASLVDVAGVMIYFSLAQWLLL